MFRGTYNFEEAEFDWGSDYQRPNIAPQDLIVYEMGVRSFTADGSSGVGPEHEGTFLGLIDKASRFDSKISAVSITGCISPDPCSLSIIPPSLSLLDLDRPHVRPQMLVQ